jgi:hypothetical protein
MGGTMNCEFLLERMQEEGKVEKRMFTRKEVKQLIYR